MLAADTGRLGGDDPGGGLPEAKPAPRRTDAEKREKDRRVIKKHRSALLLHLLLPLPPRRAAAFGWWPTKSGSSLARQWRRRAGGGFPRPCRKLKQVAKASRPGAGQGQAPMVAGWMARGNRRELSRAHADGPWTAHVSTLGAWIRVLVLVRPIDASVGVAPVGRTGRKMICEQMEAAIMNKS